jgi:hypothetical protein
MPTDKTLAQVLQLYRDSAGRAVQPVKTSREVDTVEAYGETGTYSDVESGDDYIETYKLGPTFSSNGRYHGQRWRQNENGYTRKLTGLHNETQTSSQALGKSMRGEVLDSVKLLGEVAEPVAAYVVEVHPPAGRHEWLFIDKATGRLDRKEESRLDRRIVWTYDDYRTTNGLSSAWHQHYADGLPGNDTDWRTTELAYGAAVSPADLTIPPSRNPVVFPSGVNVVRLPVRIQGGAIIVRVSIAGRGLDFQLDSGSDAIVIDRDVARQLGLSTFGENTEEVAGKFEASNAIIPEMDIGDLSMRHVAVQCLPFNFQPDASTKVVGLLGYDFLAGMVAKIDYLKGTVDAYDSSRFSTPAGQLFELQMTLDDSVPVVGARIGQSVGDYFIVDTGSPDVVLFSAFASAHPADIVPFSFKVGQKTYFPLVFAQGVGGSLALRPVTVSAFHFGGVGFQNMMVMGTYGAQDAFQGEDYDGLIGVQFLSYFDVYLDYKDSMLMLQPNERLTKRGGG